MNIQRAASTILFLRTFNNNAGAPLFLFSQIKFNEHLLELFNIVLSSFPDIKALWDSFNALNGVTILIIASMARILYYFIFLFVKKSFVEQGSLMFKEYRQVFKSGLSSYIILISVIILFFLSAVGIPVSVALLAVLYIIVLTGEASVSVAIGRAINKKIKRLPLSIEIDLFVGALLLELSKAIPFVNICLYLFVIPIISLGVIITAAINGFIKKVIYTSDYSDENVGNIFNNNLIRDIILTGGKAGGCNDEKKP